MSKIEEPGRYTVTASSAEFGESQTGTQFLAITFVTEAKQYITGWLYLSEKALENSLKTLRSAFGFDGNFETAPDQIAGKPCSITVEAEEYNGEEKLKVKWINAPRAEISDKESFLKTLTLKAARIPTKASPAAAPTRTSPAAKPTPVGNRGAIGQAKPAPTASKQDLNEDVPF